MSRLYGRSVLRLLAIIVLAAGNLTGCHKWVPVEPPLPELEHQATKNPTTRDRLRLTSGGDSTVVGEVVDLRGDSLFVEATDGSQQSLVTADIEEVERLKLDGIATAGLVVGLAALIAGMVALYATGDLWE